jgi:hypothetical protein
MLSHLKTWFEKSENGMVTKSGGKKRRNGREERNFQIETVIMSV